MLKLDTFETSWKAKVSNTGGVLQAEVCSVWFHVTIFLNDTFHPWKPLSVFFVGGETWVLSRFCAFHPGCHPFSFTSNPLNQAKWKTQCPQLFWGEVPFLLTRSWCCCMLLFISFVLFPVWFFSGDWMGVQYIRVQYIRVQVDVWFLPFSQAVTSYLTFEMESWIAC